MAAVVLNIFGAPSAGKSTAAYLVTGLLKKQGILAEYVREAIKWRMYYGTDAVALANQDLLVAEQYQDLLALKDKVSVIVTDSPLLMQMAYHNDVNASLALGRRTIELFNKFDNFNVVLERKHRYDGRHRYQTEAEADQKHLDIIKLLKDCNEPYNVFVTVGNMEHRIVDLLTTHYAL